MFFDVLSLFLFSFGLHKNNLILQNIRAFCCFFCNVLIGLKKHCFDFFSFVENIFKKLTAVFDFFL